MQSRRITGIGGGTVTLPGAPALLQEKTLCIYLKASLETLAPRLQNSGDRPLLAAPGDLERLLADEIIISVL